MSLVGSASTRPAKTALVALAAALALVVGLALLGPPAQGQFAGHDAPFALAALAGMQQAWGAVPGVPPGWLSNFLGGLGAPVFLFYPPLAFLIAGAFAPLGVTEVAWQLSAALLVARLAGIWACWRWIRGFAGPSAALVGAAAFALFPYNALFNPVVRFAFAEAVANALLPFLLLAIAAELSPRRRAAAIALGFAAIGAAHVPTALMALICGGTYALALGLRRATEASLGFALGIGLLAFHLVPALLLGPEISSAELKGEGHSFRGTMLFWGSMATGQLSLVWLLLYAAFALALAAALLAWRVAPPGPAGRAAVLGGLVSLAFITPLTLPAWMLLPPMDYIQFPWRFLSPASLFFAAHVALVAEAAERAGRPRPRRAVALGVAALALVLPAFLGLVAVAKPAERIAFPGRGAVALMAGPDYVGPPEYVPQAAREAGWVPHVRAWRLPPGVGDAPAVLVGAVTLSGLERGPGGLRIAGRAEGAATLRVPLLAFPGWAPSGGGASLGVDAATGLVTVSLPPGPFDILLRREAQPITRAAALGSALVLLGVLALALLPARRRAPAPRVAGARRAAVE